MDKEPMTRSGYNKLTAELDHLKLKERPETVIALDEARQLGDLKENAEYHAAKEKLKIIDAQIAEHGSMLAKSIVIDPATLPHHKVSFGSTVQLIDCNTEEEFTYSIVGAIEANPEKGLISFNSPLAKQLLGKEAGDEFKAQLPGGVKEYEVDAVYYKELDL